MSQVVSKQKVFKINKQFLNKYILSQQQQKTEDVLKHGENLCLWVLYDFLSHHRASQVALVVKTLLANAGDIRDVSLIPMSGRSSGGGHGNPL